MEIVINTATIISFAALITALGIIIGLLWKIFSEYKKINDYDTRITDLKDDLNKKIDENHSDNAAKMQHMAAQLELHNEIYDAILDGLEQLGCNHTVTEARAKLFNYLNKSTNTHGVKTI